MHCVPYWLFPIGYSLLGYTPRRRMPNVLPEQTLYLEGIPNDAGACNAAAANAMTNPTKGPIAREYHCLIYGPI